MERQNDEVNVFEYFIFYCFYFFLLQTKYKYTVSFFFERKYTVSCIEEMIFLQIIYSQLDCFGCSAGDCLNLRCFCPLLINSLMHLDLIYFGVMHVFTFLVW